MDVTKLLLEQLGDSGIGEIASQIGANQPQTQSAIEGIVPTILGAMSNNANSSDGANSLLGALDRDHDGSIFDDVSGFIGSFSDGPGAGILGHVLGSNQGAVEQGLSQKTGLNSMQIGKLMQIVAPLIMGFLGKQKREGSGGIDIGSIAGLLGGLSQTADQSTSLDLGDVLNVVGGGGQGGVGGLLGSLFKG